jgi:AmmeMemoRadiSam system protein B
MSLVFAAITPHPPILIPAIGKDSANKISRTAKSMEILEEHYYSAHPDTVIIISPHGSYFSDAFTINCCTDFTADMKNFGDLSVNMNFAGDFYLAQQLRDMTKEKKIPSVLISEPRLDHGSVVPMYFFSKHNKKTKILQLGFCDLDFKSHLDFGLLIKETIHKSHKRIAIVASADLSHALSSDAPAGFSKQGEEFDEKIRQLLMSNNLSGLLQINPSFAEKAAECGLRSLLILAGILQGARYNYKEYSYEAPFGVGYLTAELAF